MNIKHCPNCGENNIIVAKFCINCRFSFAESDKLRTGTASVKPITPKKVTVPDTNEKVEAIEINEEEQVGLVAYLMNAIKSKVKPKTGVKFGDIVATEKPEDQPSRPIPKNTPTAKQIYESTKYKLGESLDDPDLDGI